MVRKMKHHDFTEVKKIFQEVQDLHVEGRPDIFIVSDPCPLKEFTKRMHSKKMIKLVFVDDRKVKGFIFAEVVNKGSFQTKKRKILAIHELGVKKESRHLGIGSKLINEIKRIAELKGIDELSLSVWAFNEKAFNFYIKNGFQIQSFRMEFEK